MRTQTENDVNPDFERLNSELEAYELMIAGYVGSIVRAARLIPDDKWNWSFSERTPTAREVCEHTFAWLVCDRQQMTLLDRSQHRPTPDPPADRQSMIRLLEEEARTWRHLIRSLSPEQMLDERESWDGEMRLIRSFLFHCGQEVVYKTGQIWMLAFELGLDGSEPYNAPYPNRYYDFTDWAPWPSPRA
ncbi:MAG: DinB family protein [Fimbriimonadaceae bacterium]